MRGGRNAFGTVVVVVVCDASRVRRGGRNRCTRRGKKNRKKGKGEVSGRVRCDAVFVRACLLLTPPLRS